MVLHPICETSAAPGADDFTPAWDAVFARQRQPAKEFLLIAQPDHAHLSGELALHMNTPAFPKLDEASVRAIWLHDEGWEPVDGMSPHIKLHTNGSRPKSFLEFPPADFLAAWTRSIQHAERVSALGGMIVSRHFVALADYRVKMVDDPPEDRERIRRFTAKERDRHQRLRSNIPVQQEKIEHLLRVLQFTDLLSLYLCSGASDAVEFSQSFLGQTVRLRKHGRNCELTPSPFPHSIEFSVKAMKFVGGKLQPNPVRLSWELR